ncbi:MAG TPA: hypothetical protein VL329_10430 [Nitrospiraceae bacterium]|nr:hypothetical protein [Nitrospiraceae bacterium]
MDISVWWSVLGFAVTFSSIFVAVPLGLRVLIERGSKSRRGHLR